MLLALGCQPCLEGPLLGVVCHERLGVIFSRVCVGYGGSRKRFQGASRHVGRAFLQNSHLLLSPSVIRAPDTRKTGKRTRKGLKGELCPLSARSWK